MGASIDELKPAIESTLIDMGLELFDLKFISAGRHSRLRVFIDKQGGVSVADCEQASNRLSVILDVEEFGASTYTLEVSSPGIDRPLKTQKDFIRSIGQTLRMQLTPGKNRKNEITGRLTKCENSILTLETAKGAIIEVPIGEILHAKIEITFK